MKLSLNPKADTPAEILCLQRSAEELDKIVKDAIHIAINTEDKYLDIAGMLDYLQTNLTDNEILALALEGLLIQMKKEADPLQQLIDMFK